jgi:Zn-dependent M28 family amino/carboxypeptidase
MSPFSRLAFLVGALITAFTLPAAPIEFTKADAQAALEAAGGLVTNCTPRDAGTLRGRLAANWILERVSRLGVDATLDKFRATTPDGERTFANVVVEFAGAKTNAQWIVVMSHFDTMPNIGEGFQGANDGASTTGLLIALAGALRRAEQQPDNIALVWTDGEECRKSYGPNDGFQGSKHLADTYSERRRVVKAALCVDMLGDRNLNITIPANTTPVLKTVALGAAARAGMSGKVSLNDSIVVKDDHSPFLDAGFPSICLIDFDFGSAPGLNDWWHTPNDTIDKISAESLHASGRLVAEILNTLQK